MTQTTGVKMTYIFFCLPFQTFYKTVTHFILYYETKHKAEMHKLGKVVPEIPTLLHISFFPDEI